MKRTLPFLFFLLIISGCILAQQNISKTRITLRELSNRAAQGEPRALYELARLHDSGFDSIEIDSIRSTALYLLAAEKGYAPARNFIGFRYYNGEKVNKDIDSAIYWITLAANDGDITAASNLGFLLSQSPYISHDYNKAMEWLQKAVKANFPSAYSQLADLIRKGLGCDPDTLEAISLYEQASDLGIRDAQLKLLSMMKNKWSEITPDSALRLGIKYYTGSEPIAGVYLIEKAAMADLPQALALLGDAYAKGLGIHYNHQKSIEFFTRAAEKGNHPAQFILAELLEFFPDISESENAQYWYEKAKKGGIYDSETAYRFLLSPP